MFRPSQEIVTQTLNTAMLGCFATAAACFAFAAGGKQTEIEYAPTPEAQQEVTDQRNLFGAAGGLFAAAAMGEGVYIATPAEDIRNPKNTTKPLGSDSA